MYVAFDRQGSKETVIVNPSVVAYVVECDPSFDERFCTIAFSDGVKVIVKGTAEQVCHKLGVEIKR